MLDNTRTSSSSDSFNSSGSSSRGPLLSRSPLFSRATSNASSKFKTWSLRTWLTLSSASVQLADKPKVNFTDSRAHGRVTSLTPPSSVSAGSATEDSLRNHQPAGSRQAFINVSSAAGKYRKRISWNVTERVNKNVLVQVQESPYYDTDACESTTSLNNFYQDEMGNPAAHVSVTKQQTTRPKLSRANAGEVQVLRHGPRLRCVLMK